ncbi:hypothetical protein [Kordia jejudonensis]|uniref:hypothetical protein n=1 Tax=Kordia jejudonensis TaxID=1348245 RepID=UPI00062944C8|nr:hypothetical protein [Kordia jejudonensis]
METTTTKTEIANELETTSMFCGPDESKDTAQPESGKDTETVDPNSDGGGNNGESKEGEERPGGF